MAGALGSEDDASSLLEKYRAADKGTGETASTFSFHQQVLSYKPQWSKDPVTQDVATQLSLLEANKPAVKTRLIMNGDIGVLGACLKALASEQDKVVQWVLALMYDALREDSSCYLLFEMAIKAKIDVYTPFTSLLKRETLDPFVADKAAWILSGVMGHNPSYFSEQQVNAVLDLVVDTPAKSVSDLSALESIVHLLKSDKFRAAVWRHSGVSVRILRVEAKSASAPFLYKCVFAIWMLSYDIDIVKELKGFFVVKKIREIISHSRVEKVIRLCLTVLRNFLGSKVLSEDIVEEGILEAVQALEYEKWRDAEIYDDIKETAQLISAEVVQLSNFERYLRELETGKLRFGFVHTPVFWQENAKKFEQNDFKALKMLAALLTSNKDTTTLAVACRDIGEFVAVHPMGKKMTAKLGVKELVMDLMGSTDPEMREVRREALLCCQKIMLNKWQDMDGAK